MRQAMTLMVRLQKILAEAGLASRRAAEKLILEGRVAVNGQIVRELGTKVEPGADQVQLDGKPVRPKRKLYVALHKPPGYICSRRDDSNRPLAGSLLPKEWANLYPIGRLDLASEGLILFTNDGEFCLRIAHPRYGVSKRYIATVDARVTAAHLEAIRHGVVHEGERLKAEHARLISANNSHSVVELEMKEGRYREVRRLFEVQSLVVSRLVRFQIGNLKLGDLPAGRWRVLQPSEVKALMSQEPTTPRKGPAAPNRARTSSAEAPGASAETE